jgi:hypothetical protein
MALAVSDHPDSVQEVPYALPPARFQAPKPLPVDFRYAEKEYTSELYCAGFPFIFKFH